MMKIKSRSGFTIVELIVVVAVIAILAGIVILSYGAWRTSVATASLKSDLAHAASAMESARTFSANGLYPTSTLPSSFTASTNNVVSIYTPSDGTVFCLNGTSGSIQYYIDNVIQSKGAAQGTCASRTTLTAPASVTNVTFATTSTKITVNWSLVDSLALQYEVECANDPGFITGIIDDIAYGQGTVQDILNGANPTTTYYCRVRAINNNGTSAWNNSTAGNTQQRTCTDSNQYGTYPDCYNYDSFPVGTSIAGFWSTPPSEYLLEDGRAVSRTTYASLFALIGTTYGAGDGSTTFNLPDSRGRVSVNQNASDTQFATIGELYGEKAHTISLNETPSHSHAQYVTANSGGGAVRLDYSSDGAANGYPQGTNTQSAGGDGAANVIQPTIVMEYAIKFRPSTGTDSTLPTGTTLQGYWSTIPTNYIAEDGSAISRTTYSDLYGVVGTTYGVGNGSTTFNAPNSMGKVGVNKNPSDTQFATLGETFGEKTHLMSIAEMVPHNHYELITANTGGPAVRDDYAADGSGQSYAQGTNTGAAGGGQAFNVIQPSITKLSTVKTSVPVGLADDSGMVTGTSIEGWWSAAPSGYLLEDGTAVSRTTYAALFALLGTTYGIGDGSTTFNLPDTRGRVAANLNLSDSQFNTIGLKLGEKTHTQTLTELASHSHAQYVTNPAAGGGAIRSDYKKDASGGQYAQNVTTGPNGGGVAYNVIQPSITKMFAIKY